MGLISKQSWWVKLGLKIFLSKLSLPYAFWRRVGLFRHGDMDDPYRAIQTFEKYYSKALSFSKLPADFSSLELGPGDSVLSGVVARAYGARRVWLVDTGVFADTSIESCSVVANALQNHGKALPSFKEAKSVGDVLHLLDIAYLTEGTESLRKMPAASIDFFWSQVVLEHVLRDELPEFLSNLRRVVKPDAIGVHTIDFRDHLSGGLNSLRFSEERWESDCFRNAGFYTNRLRPREVLAMFAAAGFSIKVLAETRWPQMPIKRRVLANEFQSYSDEDFMVAEIEILLRPCSIEVKS